MTVKVQSAFRDNPLSAAQTLIGTLGGTPAVPFYYNRLYNLNRDGSNNFIQWADAIRGYSGGPPVITVNQFFGLAQYDGTKGLVSPGGNVFACGTALSTSYRPPQGSPALGITVAGAQCVWMVGEIDAGQSSTFGGIWRLASQDNSDVIELGISSAGFYQVSYGPNTSAAVNSISADGTRRLIVVTLVTGNNHGIQVPTHGALVQSSTAEPTRTSQPYALTLFPGDAAGGINSMAGSIAELGALTRSPSASDLTLLENNAVSVHGATL